VKPTVEQEGGRGVGHPRKQSRLGKQTRTVELGVWGGLEACHPSSLGKKILNGKKQRSLKSLCWGDKTSRGEKVGYKPANDPPRKKKQEKQQSGGGKKHGKKGTM